MQLGWYFSKTSESISTTKYLNLSIIKYYSTRNNNKKYKLTYQNNWTIKKFNALNFERNIQVLQVLIVVDKSPNHD